MSEPFRREESAPAFSEPWHAQAFAMTLALYEKGLFTWSEWTRALGAEIAVAGPHDDGSRYYEHWLAALEGLVVRHGVASAGELAELNEAWNLVARETPHGQPILLERNGRGLGSG